MSLSAGQQLSGALRCAKVRAGSHFQIGLTIVQNMAANTDKPEPIHRYSADRPLESTKEDKLEREIFAERVAADINGWHGNDSLVMSLNGEWGSGKTTLKNFIKEKLKIHRKPVIVEFNPWAWSGQDKMVEGFFGALHTKFQETDRSSETQRLAERWEALEVWTRLGAEISESATKVLTLLFGGSVTVALLTNNAAEPWMRIGGVLLGITGVLLATFFAAFPTLASRMVEYARLKAGKVKLSPDELRKEITKQLRGLRKEHGPVVVIVDDIDRLNAEEVRLLFQLVKVNADFPNLVYLLLFQTDIVTKALSEVAADSGSDYLKKIVQVPIEVPQASRALMLQMFIKSLDEILSGQKIKIRWDRKRYLDVFEDNVWPYLKTLRDVKRFLGTFDFYFHGQAQDGTLQINPLDLLIVEVLRSFDHEIYLDIRDSLGSNLPTKIIQLLFHDKSRKDEITIGIESIINRHGKDEAHKTRLRAILQALFPEGLMREEQNHMERDLRVCHPEHFPKYFQHGNDTRATSAANINQLLGTVYDRDKLRKRLLELINSNEIDAVFGKLGIYFEDIPVSAAEPFIGALFDVSEDLPEAGIGNFNQDTYRLAGRMTYFMLGRLPDSATRAHMFDKCLASSKGITAPVIAMGMLDGSLTRKGAEVFIPAEELAPIRMHTLERIKEYANSGEMLKSEHIGLFLYHWVEWENQADVNTWLEKELTTPFKKIEFLSKMLGKSLVGGSRLEYFLDGASLEKFINIEELAGDIANIPDDQLTKHQILSRLLLQRTVKLKADGNGYGEVRQRGDFDPEPEDEDGND